MAGQSDTFWPWAAHESIPGCMKSTCEQPAILEENGDLSVMEVLIFFIYEWRSIINKLNCNWLPCRWTHVCHTVAKICSVQCFLDLLTVIQMVLLMIIRTLLNKRRAKVVLRKGQTAYFMVNKVLRHLADMQSDYSLRGSHWRAKYWNSPLTFCDVFSLLLIQFYSLLFC